MIKALFVLFGTVFLLIGIVGIFTPLLPTTPFLILAAYFFNKGSPRFHSWLVNHRIFGPPIQDWNKRKVIKPRYKMLATSMILLSAVVLISKDNIPIAGKIFMVLFLGAITFYIWRQKSR